MALPALAQIAPNRYALFLEDEPVVSRFPTRERLLVAEADAYRIQIEAKQQALRTELGRRSINVTGSVSTLLNAVFITLPSSRLQELSGIPGVIGVVPMRAGHMNLNKATGLMNAPAAWTKVGGQQNAGKGIKIAILDTGIDQTHPAFQDNSLSVPAGFPKCNDPSDCANFTNNKVIVARSYAKKLATGSDPKNPAADSRPDDYSARDRVGHGTALASIAAGNQNSGTVTFTGMAPKAYLGNYKIYGSPGVNDGVGSFEDVWIQAINDALTDGMDVANLSSGVPALSGPLDTGATCGYAAGVPCDPLAMAFEKAAQAGMVIVVSAGNGGQNAYNYPTYNSISSPANAPSVIAAGAIINSHVFQPSVSVKGTGAPSNVQGIAAVMSDSFFVPSTYGASTAPLIDVTTLGDNGLACNSLPVGSLNGAYVLIKRGTCAFTTKTDNAAAAGAIGVIIYWADTSTMFNLEGICFNGPVVSISNADGVNLANYLASHKGSIVTIDTAGVEQDVGAYSKAVGISPVLAANQLASFSSVGPNLGDSAIKPDLVATGGFDLYQSPDPCNPFLPAPHGLYAAGQSYDPLGFLYTQNGYIAADGTSFSAPMTAGAAALIKQLHPTWTGLQIRSALVNTAAGDATTDTYGTAVDVQSVGAGRLDAGAAANASVTANPATISFGALKTGALPIAKTFQVTNLGSASVTLAVAVVPGATTTATVAMDQPNVTVAAGASATIKATLSGTIPAAGEYSGTITLQASGVSMRIPYMFLVGSGTGYNVNPLFGFNFGGVAGTDIGYAPIQITDARGVPVPNVPVTFSVRPLRSITFNSVTGSPACTPASSSTTISCPTDNFGIAWVDLVAGTSITTSTVTYSAAGVSFTGSVQIGPPATISAGGVVNAAAANANTPVAPGSYISIYGAAMSGGAAAATYVPLPFSLNQSSVSFDVPSAGISVPGRMVYVSPGQINLQVPWELQGQSAALVKVILGETFFSNVVTVPLADTAPAFFEGVPGSIAALDENYAIILSSNPVQRGHVAQLYGNGLGPVSNPPKSGENAGSSPLSSTKATPTVTIGGQPAQVLFSGLAPGFPGLYQVNVVVPAGIGTGSQPVILSIGGQTAKTSAIPVK